MMRQLFSAPLLLASLSSCLVVACGGGSSPPPETAATAGTSAATPPTETTAEGQPPGPPKEAEAGQDETTTSRTVCTGRDINLDVALIQSVCELKDSKNVAQREVKGILEVKASSASKVAPGEHVDVVVTYSNKGKLPLPLDFMIDPVPRFSVEAYDAKGNKRVDIPKGQPPPPPKDAGDRPSAAQGTARVILSPGGTARIKISWEAVRTKWAPEKYKGTPPEMGYPRKPAGPLPSGKYQLRVMTPLINVAETESHEYTAPKLDIEIGK